MATKKKKRANKKPKKKVNREEEFLLILIAASEHAIGPRGSSVDQFFRDQADRLKLELETLRAKNEAT